MALANRWVTNRQLGFLLGFMGTRVLGQYDLALLSMEADARPAPVRRGEHPGHGARAGRPDRPVPDLDRAARDDPRLRVRGASRGCGPTSPSGSSASSRCSAATRAASAARRCAGIGRAIRGEGGGEHWMERLMGPEQQTLFREMQAVMSLLEGFSDYVMDEVGRELVPDVERISARFHERRTQPHAVRAGGAPADRPGPQARAVPEGRAVRPGHRRRSAGRPPSPASGTGPRRCRATARSRRPSAGSPGSSTGGRGVTGPAARRRQRRPGQRARAAPRRRSR